MKRRQLVLGLALAITLGAVWWAAGLDEGSTDTEVAVARSSAAKPASRRAGPAPRVDLSRLSVVRNDYGDRAPAVFGLSSQKALAQAQAEARAQAQRMAAPPPKPRAPAMPYTYIGSLEEEGGQRMLFLLDGERLVTARVGDVLDSNYRVSAADADGITLIYLPLTETQRIALTDTP